MPNFPPKRPLPPVDNDLFRSLKQYLDPLYDYIVSLELRAGKGVLVTSNSNGQTVSTIPEEIVLKMSFYSSFRGNKYTSESFGSSQGALNLVVFPGIIFYKDQKLDIEETLVEISATDFLTIAPTDKGDAQEEAFVWIEVDTGSVLAAEIMSGEYPGFDNGDGLYNYIIGRIIKFPDGDPIPYRWDQHWLGDISVLQQISNEWYEYYEEKPDPGPYGTTQVLGGEVWNTVTNPAPDVFKVKHLTPNGFRPGGALVKNYTLNLVEHTTGNAIDLDIHYGHILKATVNSVVQDDDPDTEPTDDPYPDPDPLPDTFSATLTLNTTSELDYTSILTSTLDKTPDDGLNTFDVQYYVLIGATVIKLGNPAVNTSLTRKQDTGDDVFTDLEMALRCHYNASGTYFAKLHTGQLLSEAFTTKVLEMTLSSTSVNVKNGDVVANTLNLKVVLTGLAAADFTDFNGDFDYTIYISGVWADGSKAQFSNTVNEFSSKLNQYTPVALGGGESGINEDLYVFVDASHAGMALTMEADLIYLPGNCQLVTPETLIFEGEGTLFCWSDPFVVFNTYRWSDLSDNSEPILVADGVCKMTDNTGSGQEARLSVNPTNWVDISGTFDISIDFDLIIFNESGNDKWFNLRIVLSNGEKFILTRQYFSGVSSFLGQGVLSSSVASTATTGTITMSRDAANLITVTGPGFSESATRAQDVSDISIEVITQDAADGVEVHFDNFIVDAPIGTPYCT